MRSRRRPPSEPLFPRRHATVGRFRASHDGGTLAYIIGFVRSPVSGSRRFLRVRFRGAVGGKTGRRGAPMENSISAPSVACPILKTQLPLGKPFRDGQYGYIIENFISSIYRCYAFENKTFLLSAVPTLAKWSVIRLTSRQTRFFFFSPAPFCPVPRDISPALVTRFSIGFQHRKPGT